MLRCARTRASVALFRSYRHISGPSTTTSAILRSLPQSITQDTLSNALSEDVGHKSVLLEPGCMLHYLDEVSAETCANFLSDTMGLRAEIRSTSAPALILRNLPSDADVNTIIAPIAANDNTSPKIVHKVGDMQMVARFTSAKEIQAAAVSVTSLGAGLRTNAVKMLEDSFLLRISNFGHEISSEMEIKVATALSKAVEKPQTIPAALPSLVARLDESGVEIDRATLQETLSDAETIKSMGITDVKIRELEVPSLFVRSKKNPEDIKLVEALREVGARSVNVMMKSKDRAANFIVSHFASSEDALQAMEKISNNKSLGKLSLAYKDASLSAVLIENLPRGTTVKDVEKMVGSAEKLSSADKPLVRLSNPSNEIVTAAVRTRGPREAEALALRINTSTRTASKGQRSIHASPHGLKDTGIIFSLGNSTSEIDMASVQGFLDEAGCGGRVASLSLETNHSAHLVFAKMMQAVQAQRVLSKNDIGRNENGVNSTTSMTLSQHPAYSVEVSGLPTDMSCLSLIEQVEKSGLPAPIEVSRSGLVKFRRNKDVVPGMKKLKDIELEGRPLSVKRYRGAQLGGQSAFDEDGEDEAFHSFSLKNLLMDHMDSDPATRFQMAKNTFQRALTDARNLNDPSAIVDSDAPKHMHEQARRHLEVLRGGGGGSTQKQTSIDNLFQLFVQRDDMRRFTADFEELGQLLGPAEEGDQFNWSQFKIQVPEDIERIAEQYQKELAMVEAGKEADDISPKDGSLTITDSDEHKSGAFSRAGVSLRDQDGHVWSGAVLDTDTTQKTMAGGRVMSFRALVVVGNLRGTAGFGTGKASSSADAVQAAFRDALRNLTHIDLYDNFGLAHDVHGKHNSCHAYIRATPRSREMVGSRLSCAILERFGIGSASIKIVGRRNPYAQCRAIFNALEKHENIDEFAKDRGKRYLSVKWAYENNI